MGTVTVLGKSADDQSFDPESSPYWPESSKIQAKDFMKPTSERRALSVNYQQTLFQAISDMNRENVGAAIVLSPSGRVSQRLGFCELTVDKLFYELVFSCAFFELISLCSCEPFLSFKAPMRASVTFGKSNRTWRHDEGTHVCVVIYLCACFSNWAASIPPSGTRAHTGPEF